MIVLIDNYDSFSHNLARYFELLGESVAVLRSDSVSVRSVLDMGPSHLVISPGPCTPAEAGISVDLVRACGPDLPVLGVCLGHQCIGSAFGGRVLRVPPVHGKVSPVRHHGRDLFAGLPSPLRVTRYHSLALEPDLPAALQATAWSPAGVVMGIRHRRLPAWGVQFHPEAVLTEHGHALLRNFLALGRGDRPPGLAPGLPLPEGPSLPGSVPPEA